jgi:hypothetical protein
MRRPGKVVKQTRMDDLPPELVQLIIIAIWCSSCAAAPVVAAVNWLFHTCAEVVATDEYFPRVQWPSVMVVKHFKHVRLGQHFGTTRLPNAFQISDGGAISESEATVLQAALRASRPCQLSYNRVLTHEGLAAVLDEAATSKRGKAASRHRGFLADEEVDELIQLSIPKYDPGMGVNAVVALHSWIFMAVMEAGPAYPNSGPNATSLGFKDKHPLMFQNMMLAALWVLPCCEDHHWWAMFFHIEQQRIVIADSLGLCHLSQAQKLLRWLSVAHEWHTGVVLDTSHWMIWHISVPQQNDGKSCGIFCWLAALHHAHGAPLHYYNSQITYYRQCAALLLLRARRQPIEISLA